MQFRTPVTIPPSSFSIIWPASFGIFICICSISLSNVDDKFRAVVNPYGVMYNPASVLHTVRRWMEENIINPSAAIETVAPQTAVFTLGTNHVYILNETGEIVDNCRKRPQRLFTEKELSVEECVEYLAEAVERRFGLSVRNFRKGPASE